jgi:hypothetical protein
MGHFVRPPSKNKEGRRRTTPRQRLSRRFTPRRRHRNASSRKKLDNGEQIFLQQKLEAQTLTYFLHTTMLSLVALLAAASFVSAEGKNVVPK